MGRFTMKTLKIMAKTISWILIVCCMVIVLSGLYSFYLREKKGVTCPTVFGIGTAVVVSGSMEEAIGINDFIITLKQEDYSVGDVVMYDAGNHPVTHRIIEKTDDTYITKGDANNVADKEPVKNEQIAGKVVFVIPGVGAAIEFMQSQLGIMIIVLLTFGLFVFPSFFSKEEDK